MSMTTDAVDRLDRGEAGEIPLSLRWRHIEPCYALKMEKIAIGRLCTFALVLLLTCLSDSAVSRTGAADDSFEKVRVAYQKVGGHEVLADIYRNSKIPLELQSTQPPILTVELNGVSVRVRLDLGDRTPLVLQRRALDAVHAVTTGESTKMQGIDGFFEVPLYKIKHLRIGGAVFSDVIARLDAERKDYTPDADTKGFLGSGLLKPYRVVIDYPDRGITLLQPSGSSSQSCSGTAVPFATGGSSWSGEAFTEADTDIGRVVLGWDTGAFTSVLKKSLVHSVKPKQDQINWVTQGFVIGGRDFGPKPFQIWDVDLPGFDGFVGNDFFATHIVCVDYPGKQLFVSQRTPKAAPHAM